MPRLLPTAAAFLLAALATQAAPARAQAAVHRCVGPDGTSIYSDRGCAGFDAAERPAPGEQPSPSTRAALQRGCARRPHQLAARLQAALASQDVNRVASVYDWAGKSTWEAQGIMERLHTLARDAVTTVVLEGSENAVAGPGIGAAVGGARVPERPERVRIERLPTPANTARYVHMALMERAGCWWVHF
ncbi:hypothetical protein [Coralloluteibacterium stylophorae]|uniref:DUF4124 domain-containing protein n=1 Tax=Coralloluteibacterium stylophorae TaxID=1776034 RepID=A0A8J7VUE1_9GAMM|nr:hypothetical protein [Coralloluteibacterium stylophorae]MBS7458275.1 hypothetical protein [Coralloluteibacterium stylophorae]